MGVTGLSTNSDISNCWIYLAGIAITGSGSATLTADQTSRGILTVSSAITDGQFRSSDTNAAQTPAGNKTVGMTAGGTGFAGVTISAASFAPIAVATIPNKIYRTRQAINRSNTY